MPVTVYHGRRDELVSLERTRAVARQLFTDLRFDEVDDDHGLAKTAREIDWVALLED
jgi:surfactin synthase thioesterase subunit